MAGIRDKYGRVLENTGPLFNELAKNYPIGQFHAFCNALGVKYNQATAILESCHHDNERAVRNVLNKWEDRRKNVTKEELERALSEAETAAFCKIVDEHFHEAKKHKEASVQQSEEEERPSTSSGPSETGASKGGTGKRTSTRKRSSKKGGSSEREPAQPSVDQSNAQNVINVFGSGSATGNTMAKKQVNYNSPPPSKKKKTTSGQSTSRGTSRLPGKKSTAKKSASKAPRKKAKK